MHQTNPRDFQRDIFNTEEPPYLNFVEQLRVKKRQLISNLMAAEVVQGSWPENDTQASQ